MIIEINKVPLYDTELNSNLLKRIKEIKQLNKLNKLNKLNNQ